MLQKTQAFKLSKLFLHASKVSSTAKSLSITTKTVPVRSRQTGLVSPPTLYSQTLRAFFTDLFLMQLWVLSQTSLIILTPSLIHSVLIPCLTGSSTSLWLLLSLPVAGSLQVVPCPATLTLTVPHTISSHHACPLHDHMSLTSAQSAASCSYPSQLSDSSSNYKCP